MKIYFILLLSLSFSIAAIGQIEYPDSGFTNKAEAKNLMVNGLKEGKWVECLDGMFHIITDSAYLKLIRDSNEKCSPYGINFYSLSVYRAGKHYGTTRWYLLDWKLWCEYPYIDDNLNGIYKIFYQNGKVKEESTFTNNITNGKARWYYPNGKIERVMTSDMGKIKDVKYFDENGEQILNGIAKFYDENGKIQFDITLKNGKKKKTRYYNVTGNEIK